MKAISSAQVQSDGPHYRHRVRVGGHGIVGDDTGGHELIADEPVAAGGQDAGPAPYDYLLAGLGACTAITLRMYAEKKGWELGELQVGLTLLKNREGDTHIERVLHSDAALSDEQWQRLLEVAAKTPVTRTLQEGATISTRRGDAESAA